MGEGTGADASAANKIGELFKKKCINFDVLWKEAVGS